MFSKDEHYQTNDVVDGERGSFWLDVLWGESRGFVTVRLLKRLVGNKWAILKGDPIYRKKHVDKIYVANKQGRPRIK